MVFIVTYSNYYSRLYLPTPNITPPGPNPGGYFGPLLLSDQDQPTASPALDTHVDDGMFLSSLYHHLTFEQRADLLYVHWDTLHAFTSVLEIKKWLESLSQSDHLLLIQLHAAYWVTAPVVTFTFGATKSRFWNAINHAGHFVNGVFVIQRNVPLASVTVESLLVRTIGQWVQYLARHELTVFQIWDVLSDDVVDFATLDNTVHPKYDVLLPALIMFANFCSDAYRTTSNIEFMLQRQAASLVSAPLNLTTVDANILLSSYFPGQYDVDNLQATDGLLLFRRAHSFVVASPTYLHWSSECNQRWIHLLACVYLPLDIDLANLTTDDKVRGLVSVFPPSFTNDQLRRTYPSLLQQPGYLLRDFLDHNDMAQIIYGTTLPSDIYGVLRLKIMGCVVAINQHVHVMDNVDSVLSRSDIYYITHVGGILRSSHHRFCSDLFNIFDVDDVGTKLAQLINSRMLVLLCSPPRHPPKLISGDRWARNFNGKLPTAERVQQAANTLVARISAVVVNPIPFNTLRPQFVQPSAHDDAMLEPATAADHIRHLAREVKLCYTRQNAPVLPPVPIASLPGSGTLAAIPSTQARFNFLPP
jgi:hypothetical protein